MFAYQTTRAGGCGGQHKNLQFSIKRIGGNQLSTALTNFQIRTVDFVSGTDNNISEVNVRFDSNESNGDYLNGSVKLTFSEYESANGFTSLKDVVKSKVQQKFASE